MKAITVYTPNGTLPVITEEALSQHIFHPLKREDEVSSRLGFTLNVEGTLVSTLAGNTCIRLAQQKKVVNKYELNRQLSESELSFEGEMGRPYNKKEKIAAKIVCTEKLLAQTLPVDDPKLIDIIITPQGKVIVGAVPKLAEECLSLLRQCIGSLPVVPLQCVLEPSACMTDMVIGGLNDIITLSNKVVLTTSEDRMITITKGQTMESEALDLIDDGAFVTALALEFDSVVKFIIKEDMSLSSVKFEKSITEEVEDGDAIGSFMLQTEEAVRCVLEVIKEFGGVVDNN